MVIRDFQELGKTLLHGRGFRTNGSMVSSLIIIGLFFFGLVIRVWEWVSVRISNYIIFKV